MSRPASLAVPAVPQLIVTPSTPVMAQHDDDDDSDAYAASSSSSSSRGPSPYPPSSLLASPRRARPSRRSAKGRASPSPSTAGAYTAALGYHLGLDVGDVAGDAMAGRRARRSASISLALLALALVLVLSSALCAPDHMIACPFNDHAPRARGYTRAAALGELKRAAPAWTGGLWGANGGAVASADSAARASGAPALGQPPMVGRWDPRAFWHEFVAEVQRGGHHALDAWDFH